MKVGDMVSHKTNPVWSRGKIYSLIPEMLDQVIVLWGNGDLENVAISEITPLGWNLHKKGD